METLVMPMNYVELQEDEMMYLDGGDVRQCQTAMTVAGAFISGLFLTAGVLSGVGIPLAVGVSGGLGGLFTGGRYACGLKKP